jgi:hypothetical protein
MNKEDALIIPSAERDSPGLPGLVEVTTYIREDQACALEMIQIAEQQHRGAPCDQAELFQEALDLLIKTRFFVIDNRTKK